MRYLRREHKSDQTRMAEIYSGKGAVEFAWTKARHIPPEPAQPPWKIFHVSLVYPRHPLEENMHDGWRKSLWGFGILHDYWNQRHRTYLQNSFEQARQRGISDSYPMV